jgi:hypothetical protein
MGNNQNNCNITEAQRKENRNEAGKKWRAKQKQKREDGFEDKSYENKLSDDRAHQAAKRKDPEWLRNRKEYENTDKYRDSNNASNKKWRNSDAGKAWYRERCAAQFEAMRRAFMKQWYDLVESGADCDLTRDDIDNMKDASAATISAEVDRFLTEEILVDGPCKGLTFEV